MLIEAQHARCERKAHLFQVAEQLMDGVGPGTDGAADGVADSADVVDGAASKRVALEGFQS